MEHKAVLLFNGNERPSVPGGYAINMKETYKNIRILLKARLKGIEYEDHNWNMYLCRFQSCTALLNQQRVYLPYLHIKQGLMINVVKALDREGNELLYLRQKFPGISEAKLEEGKKECSLDLKYENFLRTKIGKLHF